MLIGEKIAKHTYDFWVTKHLGLANEVFILGEVLFFKVCCMPNSVNRIYRKTFGFFLEQFQGRFYHMKLSAEWVDIASYYYGLFTGSQVG